MSEEDDDYLRFARLQCLNCYKDYAVKEIDENEKCPECGFDDFGLIFQDEEEE